MNIPAPLRHLIMNGQRSLLIFLTAVGLFLMTAFSAQAQSQVLEPIDVVFDLDWTLLNPTTEAMAQADPRGILSINGELYRLSEHTIEVLIALHSQPGVRVSFFSGGSVERNQQAVKMIYAEIHRRQGHMQAQPFKILSRPDLTVMSTDPQLPFAERYKKNLQSFFDLNNTLLIEDVKNLALHGQEKNLLWLRKTYNDRPQFSLGHLENPRNVAYTAPNKNEWLRDHNKLLPILEVILQALSLR